MQVLPRSGAAAMKAMQKATNIDDVDKTMDEINEQTENMKQIQEALATPIGAAADFDEVVAYTGHDDSRKFVLDGDLTLRSIKSFAEDFLEDKLKPFYKSDPIPETNDGDVKIVVGNNFDQIVLDESKDVLLEIYAPWCGHCQALEPIYNKLGKHLRGIDSLVIAKMDGVTNEHPRATTLEMLEKKEKVLLKKAAAEVEKAKEFTKAKNKRAAIQCLKRKRLYEQQIEQLGNFQLRIHDQVSFADDNVGRCKSYDRDGG